MSLYRRPLRRFYIPFCAENGAGSFINWSRKSNLAKGRIYKLGEGKVLEILSTDYTDWTDFFEEKIRKSA